jgi:hypothetical protein
MTSATHASRTPGRTAHTREQPFHTVEEAWFWTMAALTARRDGARIVSGAGLVTRPCEPDDVVKCLDRLYRHRRIDLQHARIMRIWGERGTAPDARQPGEAGDWRLWHEAMTRLDWPLRVKGIISGPVPAAGPAQVLAFSGIGG